MFSRRQFVGWSAVLGMLIVVAQSNTVLAGVLLRDFFGSTDDFGNGMYSGLGVLEHVESVEAIGQAANGEIEIAQDQRELVVQVVRNASGECAGKLKALHLL